MISYADALKQVLDQARPMPIVEQPLDQAHGLYLAQPIAAPFDLPRFNQTAVDGYAVRADDVRGAAPATPKTLALAGVVRAGDVPARMLKAGETIKVLTGAMLPEGTEAVVMREFTEESGGVVSVQRGVESGENIRKQGEEYRTGDAILLAGTRINAPVLGMLATLGLSQVPVHSRPRVVLLITGSELTAPGQPLAAGQIYDGNSFALKAACEAVGAEVLSVIHCDDEAEPVAQAITRARENTDVVITSGGASVGDYDFIKAALERLSIQPLFAKVAIKPGKPTIFAADRKGLFFGLPGNPVSALVTFYLLARPALQKMLGASDVSTVVRTATLGAALKKKPGRMEFVRARLVETAGTLTALPASGQESHMLGGLCGADCLIQFPADAQTLERRARVTVELLSWS